ncbi:hypothetical protein DiNV_CH01M_ORF104 [Drosophila innubila nudivirus]|uniref:Uncharacterized protein n=1 Tax=Drosophila innubila nudivirus TaxID=2057187 RepID=A0A2H4UX88_9VIRU|nr:hypothetical protein DiNV_CH01M_ORF104 [Drosophila innubila nudivirus]ATZ81535.1 hypothetical protein DiNV_CH01M_ORF104 [Drosophila innubila nudivirus]
MWANIHTCERLQVRMSLFNIQRSYSISKKIYYNFVSKNAQRRYCIQKTTQCRYTIQQIVNVAFANKPEILTYQHNFLLRSYSIQNCNVVIPYIFFAMSILTLRLSEK